MAMRRVVWLTLLSLVSPSLAACDWYRNWDPVVAVTLVEGHPALVLAPCVTHVSVYRDEADDMGDTLMNWVIGRSTTGDEALAIVIFDVPPGWTDETRPGHLPSAAVDVVRLTELTPDIQYAASSPMHGEAGGPPAARFTIADLDRLKPGEVVVGESQTVSRRNFLKAATTC